MTGMSIKGSRTMTDWHIRVPAPDQMRAFMAPLREAYAEDFADADVADWLRICEPDRWLGAFEDETTDVVAGAASAYTLRMTVPGGEVGAAAVTGVGTRPDYHRRGVLRSLMRRQLDDVRERGEPVAILWASEGTIYQRFGYGMATVDGFFEVPSARTAYARPVPPEGRVRIVSEEESLQLVPAVYEAMRRVTPGALSRSDTWWQAGPLSDPEYSRRGLSHKVRVVYEADGVPEGYAVYRIKDDWDHRGPKSVMEVREAVTNTPRALRGLWRYLFEVDLVRTVKVFRQSVPNPLQQILLEPRALGLIANDGLWLRLVDLPGALGARRYAIPGRLVLEVSDAFCPWNAGIWRLEADGEAWAAVGRVEPTTDAPDLVMDTTDLAAIYLGGQRAVDLAQAGRIEERMPGALRRATAMFAAERTPWCVSMF
jgi:predicted acetyltransferase